MASTSVTIGQPSYTNYISYLDPTLSTPRIGHCDLADETIQPLRFTSGTLISTLYQVIEAGTSSIVPHGPPIPFSTVKALPPLTGRDILCVGKNYAEHAKEFNKSGFDSSDKTDQPSHPVIFTKRFTSIIANGEDVLRHEGWTETLDYEGEIGVIIGKAGFRVEEAGAMEYVWGYTIVNDVTARERQRDHKQFFLGKSADGFCPMGPIAVPKEQLEQVLRVQTHVNGELRQDATTDDLIFSIPYLIKTISEGQTLMQGDVIATGTPAGVGIGRKPPIYLQPGDSISVSVNGLGTLTNRVVSNTDCPTPREVAQTSSLSPTDQRRILNLSFLTKINKKLLYYKVLGPHPNTASTPALKPNIFFLHGLGSTHTIFTPLISTLSLSSTTTCHLLDLEGAGLSPTHPLSKLSIESYTADLAALFDHVATKNKQEASEATIIAHSTGCLIALSFAIAYPQKVGKLILLSPPPSPITEDEAKTYYERADLARLYGMAAIVDTVAPIPTSGDSASPEKALAEAMMRSLLLSQDPEGYAKACAAFADSCGCRLAVEEVRAETLVVVGRDEKGDVGDGARGYGERIPGARLRVLEGVGSLHILEGLEGVRGVVGEFLGQ
ncbi:hypothetical protein CC80DRAFT_593763 [Byssothecium circinans]|uniref:Fumarylacetoacetate hydrolase-like protein n=1 Tax=Byssothecium circinans TaxID=147558 RepID=A0A6A5TV39_9PLEO|nr:hypothetical protein CC80DRAFT_593763 [Byssothecium circinans]